MRSMVLAIVLLGLVGCSDPEPIRNYEVDRPPHNPAQFAGLAEQTDAILVGVIPQVDTAWFFKLSGPPTRVDEARETFEELLRSVRFASETDQPSWTLPDGWTEDSEDQGPMRTATIRVAGDPAMEIAVSSLPFREGDEDFFFWMNVNRWRDQLQLPEATLSEVATTAEPLPLETDDKTATVYVLQGKLKAAGPMSPFASAPQRNPSTVEVDTPNVELDAPESWTALPSGGSRKAAYQIESTVGTGSVTVTVWRAPPGSGMRSKLANVNRWRKQVLLKAVDPAQLDGLLTSINIGDATGDFVSMQSPQTGPGAKAIHAAFVARDDFMWFFKLIGDPALVEQESERFKTFVGSAKFTSENEGT